MIGFRAYLSVADMHMYIIMYVYSLPFSLIRVPPKKAQETSAKELNKRNKHFYGSSACDWRPRVGRSRPARRWLLT